MYSIILAGAKNFFPKSILDEAIDAPFQVFEFNTLAEVFPSMLSEEPLITLIDGKSISENDLGIISVLRRTFPYIRILLIFPLSARDLAAKAILSGADSYILEPFFINEAVQFIRHAYDGALKEARQTVKMRMESLSLFIQGLAPEMNNRLTPVLGSLQLLMSKNDSDLDDLEKQENYECIYRESLRMARILDELENFARPRKPKKNTVSLKKTVQLSITDAEKESRNEVPIKCEINTDIDRVLIDQRQISHAISAVIRFLKENADEAKGHVEISVYTPEKEYILLTIEGVNTVRIGEEANNAFIPLYLRRIVRFGHELGLSSSYGLINANGGSIKIKTTQSGSKFNIQIPLKEIQNDKKKQDTASY